MSITDADLETARAIIYRWDGDVPPEKSDQVEQIVRALSTQRAEKDAEIAALISELRKSEELVLQLNRRVEFEKERAAAEQRAKDIKIAAKFVDIITAEDIAAAIEGQP